MDGDPFEPLTDPLKLRGRFIAFKLDDRILEASIGVFGRDWEAAFGGLTEKSQVTLCLAQFEQVGVHSSHFFKASGGSELANYHQVIFGGKRNDVQRE